MPPQTVAVTAFECDRNAAVSTGINHSPAEVRRQLNFIARKLVSFSRIIPNADRQAIRRSIDQDCLEHAAFVRFPTPKGDLFRQSFTYTVQYAPRAPSNLQQCRTRSGT
jgi:hypothetical protein